jgi:hypothetical protein
MRPLTLGALALSLLSNTFAAIPPLETCVAKCQNDGPCMSAIYDTVSGACTTYLCIIDKPGRVIPPTLKAWDKPGQVITCPDHVPLPDPAKPPTNSTTVSSSTKTSSTLSSTSPWTNSSSTRSATLPPSSSATQTKTESEGPTNTRTQTQGQPTRTNPPIEAVAPSVPVGSWAGIIVAGLALLVIA